MTVPSRNSRAAQAYADRGLPVLPLHSVHADCCSCGRLDCDSPAKHPRTRNGLKDASAASEQIRHWWHRWPDANIGLVTGASSSLTVIDVDVDKGGDAGLTALERSLGVLPSTLSARTGSGGRHLYFTHPGGNIIVKNAVGFLGHTGVDVRGDGGYIVVPPSRNLAGPYSWGGARTPVSLPPTWIDALTRPSKRPRFRRDRCPNREAFAHPSGPIPEGQRNARLASIAGSLRRRGASQATIAATLHATNASRCDPPLSTVEVERIATSIARYMPTAATAPAAPARAFLRVAVP